MEVDIMRRSSIIRFIIWFIVGFMVMRVYATHKRSAETNYIRYDEVSVSNINAPKTFNSGVLSVEQTNCIVNLIEESRSETFILTFYTDLDSENGPCGPVNCHMQRLKYGMVANNVLPQGTKIATKEFGELSILDTGGPNFDVRNRLDVFIPREFGESDRKYYLRVNKMGIVKVKGVLK